MLKFLRNLFGWGTPPDERVHPESASDKRIDMIEVNEPMAGAGALLPGSHIKSETEKAIERASARDT